jgi:hypothetical protein
VQITEIRNEIEKYKGEGLTSDSMRKKILTDLEARSLLAFHHNQTKLFLTSGFLSVAQDRLKKTGQKAELFDSKYQENLRVINALKSLIQALFVKIGCSAAAITEMLGNAGVTEHNIMTYLGACLLSVVVGISSVPLLSPILSLPHCLGLPRA